MNDLKDLIRMNNAEYEKLGLLIDKKCVSMPLIIL